MHAVQPINDAVEAVVLSPEMIMLIGTGAADGLVFPADAALLVFGFGGMGVPATLRLVADAAGEPLGDAEEGARSLSCVVARFALDRLFGWSGESGGRYHLT